ncbi:hypothetical protein EON64_15645 [archaeon]|nr:MAG: hypothetical protein EON64_15645 [archaeon]
MCGSLLCKCGCDNSLSDADGYNAFSLAVEKGHLDPVNLLAGDCQVDIHWKGYRHGRSALLLAISRGQHAVSLRACRIRTASLRCYWR